MTDGIRRRLAAVLAADVAGYSRLMGEDEVGTLSALRHLRTKLFVPTVDHHKGEVVKNMGDGWLVEFASVTDAVTCAIEIQEKLAAEESVKLRIGVHLGDITHEDEDIFGDGVNIAARLQEIAQPGGIVISDIARRSIDGRLAAAVVDLGVYNLKNITEPIAAFGWGMTAGTANAATLPLPDKPSIAVLPFTNMSGDPEQEFFSDGIADDIITELARYDELFVIARNSSFAFKGRPTDVREIARELGVKYVLEGSMRRAGGRVRVTAQLVDTAGGNHVWAERYDRELEDIFAVQDEITAVIVNTLVGKVIRSHFDHALLKAPENMGAYDHALRAMVHFQRWTSDDNRFARLEAEKALALDPEFARAEALLCWSNGADFVLQCGGDPQVAHKTALQSGQRAVELDNMEPWAHAALGFANIFCGGDFDYGLTSIMRAVKLNPNNAHFHGWLAIALCFNGEPEKAFAEIEIAERLNPLAPLIYSQIRARIIFTLGRLEEALNLMTQLTIEMPKVPNTLAIAAACNEALGKHEAAKELIERLHAEYPDYAISTVRFFSPFRHEQDMASYCDLLRRAGLRE